MGLREGATIQVHFYNEVYRGIYMGPADLAGWVNLKDAERLDYLGATGFFPIDSEGDVAVNLNTARAVWTLPRSKKEKVKKA